MARLFPLLRTRWLMATIFVGMTGFASLAAQAADMRSYSPVEPPPAEEPVEWGSGWYLRGDIGWQNVQLPAVTGEFATMRGVDNIVSGGLGGGYQFNDWLRADVTVDRSVFRMNRSLATVWCPYAASGLFTQDASGNDVPVGIFANPSDTCTPQSKGTLNRTSFLLNGYLDLGHYWGFTPYVGAGLGASYNQASSSLIYYRTSDGTPLGSGFDDAARKKCAGMDLSLFRSKRQFGALAGPASLRPHELEPLYGEKILGLRLESDGRFLLRYSGQSQARHRLSLSQRRNLHELAGLRSYAATGDGQHHRAGSARRPARHRLLI